MNNIDTILALLHPQLLPVTGNWMIIGTASLYLAGYPVTPNDIDILCDSTSAVAISDLLADYKVDTGVRPNQKFRSVFSEYNFNGFTVEVMGNLEVNTADGWVLLRDHILQPQTVLFNGKTFVVPSKQDQIAIYTLFNRAKDEAVLQMLR